MSATYDFGRLYIDHALWLRGWIARRTACAQSADDLVQDTFFRLIEKGLDTPLRDPRSFLVTIARRLVIDQGRRAAIERAFLEAQRVATSTDTPPSPERILAAIGELEIIVAALDTLPSRARQAFLLARLEGLEHAEIAGRIGVSKSMVKQYVAKAYACCYAASYGPRA